MDAAAIEKLIRDYGDRLYSFARSRLADDLEVEDVLQETFLAALKAGPKFRGDSSGYTWLTGILKKKIYDVYNKRTREGRFFVDLTEEPGGRNGSDRLMETADARPLPPEDLTRKELSSLLWDCVDRLDGIYGQIFRMREIDGLDRSAICQLTEATPTNVNVILYRARLRLRKCLENKGIADAF
ncbi:MAG: sigma-70 family RNA polymerase sigma factor [Spirochaetales bacterium]|nr:sigma-70 family RNA polymerase sigma factor [Spirochaetales bacterium]